MRVEPTPAPVDPVHEEQMAAWKAAREGTIGGSSAPAAIGLGRFGSRVRLWAEMTGQLEPDENETQAMLWGSRQEPVLAAALFDGSYPYLPVAVVPENGELLEAQLVGVYEFPRFSRSQPLYRSKERPWQTYSPDGFALEKDGDASLGLVEFKTTGIWSSAEWAEEPPEHVQIQVHHGLAVTGLTWAVVAVLVAGNDFRVFHVERDEELVRAIVSEERAFLNHVTDGTRPPLEVPANPDTLRVLKQLHPDDNGETVQLPEKAHELGLRLQELRQAKNAGRKAMDSIEAELLALIGDATFGETPADMEGRRLTFSLKTTERKGYVAKPAKYRTLRIKEA